jgi:hypothetical protein
MLTYWLCTDVYSMIYKIMWLISKYYNKILYIYSLSHFIFYVDFTLLYILECMNFLEFHVNVLFLL